MMGKNGEYLENPGRQNILRELLNVVDTLRALFLQEWLLQSGFITGSP